MNKVINEFMPRDQNPDETYDDYLRRLEEAIVLITSQEKPTRWDIKALAHIATEAPTDFNWVGQREIQPFRRMRKFLDKQPKGLRNLFRSEARKLAKYKTSRINSLLGERKINGH